MAVLSGRTASLSTIHPACYTDSSKFWLLSSKTVRIGSPVGGFAACCAESLWLSGQRRTSYVQAGRLGVVAQEARRIRRHLANAAEFSSKSITTTLTALRIGDACLLALPFENSADTGNFLWRQARVTPVCYANGYWGYLPSASAAEKDYEVVSSPFSRQADEVLRRAAVALARSADTI